LTIDYLIIGQGLAGSLLAWQLQQQGQNFLIVDNASVNAASRIAAGLVTPITGKRLVKSPGLDLFLAAAKSCYQQIEQSLTECFYHQRPITRVLQSKEELSQYQKRIRDSDYSSYLKNYQKNSNDTSSNSIYGSFDINQGGFLDSALLVERLAEYFMQQGVYRRANIEYADITIDADRVYWQDVTARHLIFCEGYSAINNPWFNWLPFTPTKGEILQCSIDTPITETIIHAGKWLLPLAAHTFRCGATYDWDNLDLLPTQQARTELLEAAHKLFPNAQIEVINHQVGIRPGTRDRQAFIGQHPEHKPLFIFNGFGSKGALMIPFYSQQFSNTLSGQSAPIDNADIARYH
jgi:glycine/D-amino acid oxidase-like deaminating enzyme